MRFSTLPDWLGWLEKSHPTEIDLGLERIRQVAERLQLLNHPTKTLTVAGTNGKGSCVTACAALLQAAHYSVGVYTSPHLLHYAERIQINGKPVSDYDICTAFEKIAEASAEISLTYFEYGTLAALEIFKQHQVDYRVLEVGLGGRLDATNIIDADVGIITSIALDHQDWLGDTRELIGREKAGVLREGKIFICADENPPQSVIDAASDLKTQHYFLGRDFSSQVINNDWYWQGKNGRGNPISLPVIPAPHLPLPSMAAALQAIYLLDIELPHSVIKSTFSELTLAGRFQKIIFQKREFILDVAHNPAATQYFAHRLSAEPCNGKTHAIVGMMADKDRIASVANLISLIDSWHLLDLAHIARAATVEVLRADLAALQIQTQSSGTIGVLMSQLLSTSAEGDRIVVFGSFHTVAAALSYLKSGLHDLSAVNRIEV